MKNMDWDVYRCFMTVARGGGLTGAAHATGLSPATIGRRMLELEERTGRVLFVRSQTGYALTAEGRFLFEQLQEMEAAARKVESWQKEGEARPPLSWVAQTRRGHGYQRKPDNTIVFNVDFEGPALRKYTEDGQLQAVVTADANAQLVESEAHPNYATRGWRLRVRLRRLDDAKPVELRAFLRGPEGALSETWSYLLPPP